MATSKIGLHDLDKELLGKINDSVGRDEFTNVSNKVYALQSYVNYSDTEIIGVEVDYKNNIVTRLAGAVGHEAGDDFFNSFGAYNRRRCNVADDGTVNAYYGDDNYAVDGSNGMVMVEQPAFYYRVEPLELEAISGGIGHHLRKARYYISNTPREGFRLHPAFIENGIMNDKVYVAAYRGCLYDTSAAAYCLDDSATADKAADLLASISGAKPASGDGHTLTRDISRLCASNRGSGWYIRNIQTASMTQLLFLVEYASMNIQNKIGIGHTDGTWNSVNDAQATGSTNDLGNISGQVTNPSTNIKSVNYRGEEDLFGMWEFIDGANVDLYSRNIPYIADNNYADNKITDNYLSAGFTLAKANGYVSAVGYSEDYDWLFLGSEVTGNSNGVIGDYAYQNNTGSFIAIARLGGSCYNGGKAGLGCWSWDGSSSVSTGIGARLRFMPNK